MFRNTGEVLGADQRTENPGEHSTVDFIVLCLSYYRVNIIFQEINNKITYFSIPFPTCKQNSDFDPDPDSKFRLFVHACTGDISGKNIESCFYTRVDF